MRTMEIIMNDVITGKNTSIDDLYRQPAASHVSSNRCVRLTHGLMKSSKQAL